MAKWSDRGVWRRCRSSQRGPRPLPSPAGGRGGVIIALRAMRYLIKAGAVSSAVEQWTFNPLVDGSIPSRPTILQWQARHVISERMHVVFAEVVRDALHHLVVAGADAGAVAVSLQLFQHVGRILAGENRERRP